MSVRLSALNNLAPIARTCIKFDILSIFRTTVEKIQVSSKSDKNKGYFRCRPIYSFDHMLFSSSQNEKVFQTKVVEKIDTFYVQYSFFFFKNFAVKEIM